MWRGIGMLCVTSTIVYGFAASFAFAQSAEEDTDVDVSDAPATVDVEEGAAPTADSERDLALVVDAGGGLGSRVVRLPTGTGERNIDLGWFPAAELAVSAAFGLSTRSALELAVHYQTSVALTGTESSSTNHDLSTSVRSHEVSFGLTPTYRFADATDAVHAGLFVGWGFRGLRPVIELRVPAYSLSGPMLRAELGVPLLNGVIEIRLAPEAQWLAFVSDALQTAGATAATGLAFGAEASLVLQPTHVFTLQLAYREVRAQLSSHWNGSVRDSVRWVSLRAALHY